MGQYYKAYLRDVKGREWAFNPQNAIYMTANGLESADQITEHSYDWDDPKSWGSCFSGMKLLEHSWMGNAYVNGIMEMLLGSPHIVAWVGDYADDAEDFDGRYTEEIYDKVYSDGDGLPELPFKRMPFDHRTGFVIDWNRSEYIDLAEYAKHATDGNGWCIHPLPLLTAIGNGRGGGDYWWSNPNADMVGAWAMDAIEFAMERPLDLREVDYGRVMFMERE